MGNVAVRPLVSEKEFLSLPESTEKIELIDGEVIVSPSPTYWHQQVLLRLVVALQSWAVRQKQPVTVGLAPLDVRFARNRILQPDAFVILGSVNPAPKGPLDRIPELCIEVLSGNRVHDRVTKRLLYGAAGVKEYWVVEPARVIERWTGEGLSEDEVVQGTLTSSLLPRFRLSLRTLFAGLPRS